LLGLATTTIGAWFMGEADVAAEMGTGGSVASKQQAHSNAVRAKAGAVLKRSASMSPLSYPSLKFTRKTLIKL